MSTILLGAFVQHDIIFGGLTDNGEGYVAYGFGGGEKTSSFVFEEFHPLSAKGVRAIATYKSRTYVAGGFLHTKGSSAKHIAAFDGTGVFTLGSGVDGLVNDLAVFNNILIVGGVFTKVFGRPAKRLAWFNTGVLHTGGLATWNGSDWDVLGSRPLPGIVTSLHANGSIIYVGGRFNDEGRKNNLAMFNGKSWYSVCGLELADRHDTCGVSGGEVLAMATLKGDLYVGGSFSRAGGLQTPKIARWDGQAWFAMSALDGDVHALAILGGRVFASGMFGDKSVTKSQSSYLVRWQSGSWESLQGGVGGPVFTMLAMDSCLYVGGLFDSVGGMDEISGIKVHNAARWCFDRNGRVESKWSAVQWPNDQIGVCRVIKSS